MPLFEEARDEQVLAGPIDRRLLGRLVRYARPQAGWIGLALVLALAVTAADLVRPYLLKVAIDDHLQGYSRPMVDVSTLPPGHPARAQAVAVAGRLLAPEAAVRRTAGETGLQGLSRVQALRLSGQAVLVEGVVAPQPALLPADLALRRGPGGVEVAFGEGLLPAVLLSEQEWGALVAPHRRALAGLAAVVAGVALISQAMAFAMAYVMQWAGQQAVLRLRSELFRHVEGRAPAFFDRQPAGRLVTRLTNDTETLSELYSSVVVNLGRDLFVAVGVVVAMARLDARLAAASLLFLPAVVGATWAFRTRARAAYRQVRLKLARVNAFLAENLHGMWLVKAFVQERRQLARFDGENEALRAALLQEVNVVAVFRPVVDFLGNISLAWLLWYGGSRVAGGGLEYGVLYAFLTYLRQLFQPIHDLAEKYNVLQAAMASAERIFQLMDDPTALVERPPSRPLPARGAGLVELEGVWFAYHGQHWVLQDVSLTVRPGETVGLVGATGAGKSSVVGLIARMYDVQKGAVRLDGVDVREVPLAWLRRQVAVVSQDPVLFTGTVAFNVGFGLDEPDPAALREAARRAGVGAFIEALPGGYRYAVHARGAGLSAGQRQMVALARALAADPAVLVLDEATAHVDSETEAWVQRALQAMRGQRTVIVVAHRLGSVRHADRIVVLHRGRVREVGTHQELIALGGLYCRLWELQSLDAAAPAGASGAG